MSKAGLAPSVLRLILAEAEVELAPPEIAGHPAVRATAKDQDRRPGEVLLDQNAHSAAIAKLEDGKRRGRPDILHYTLLTILESPLNKAGLVEVGIHTRHGLWLRVRPDTRLPRGEARFQGILAKVLREGRSHDKDPLVWCEQEEATPNQVIRAFAKGPVLRLDEGGATMTPAELVGKAQGEQHDLTLVLGVFPSGAFGEKWVVAAPETASLWPEPLNAWAIASEVMAGARAAWNVSQPRKAAAKAEAKQPG